MCIVETSLEEKKKQIIEALMNGNSVEIHSSREGIKVAEVRVASII